MNSSSSRLVRAGSALASLALAFFGWGYLMTPGYSPAPASVASTQSPADRSAKSVQRKPILKEAKSSNSNQAAASSTRPLNILFNDSFIQDKWGLQKTKSHRAWEISQGSKDIVVAVIDTGIDVQHPDLADNLWVNPGESGRDALGRDKSANGLDDDGNGLPDDVHGWNFVHNNGALTDNHGHGTHIAGIIGARGVSRNKIIGVAPNVSLMILKYYDPKASNSNNLKNTIEAIRYAIAKKVHIINYSGGGTDYSAEEYAVIREAERNGILFIAAAGNEKSNSDEKGKHYYPADYELSNIISVTAVTKEETKVLASSNYGVHTVDLAAPGEEITSTLPGNTSGKMTGTSQATAFVTGVAALIMAHNPDFSAADVKKYILKTGDEYPTLLSKTGTAKLLNSYKALTSLDMGVGFTGVIASNTSHVGPRAFRSDHDLKRPVINVSALNANPVANEEPAEKIALFGKEFLRAMHKANLDAAEADEIRRP